MISTVNLLGKPWKAINIITIRPYFDGFYHPLSLMVKWGTVCCCFTNSSEHVATINLLVEGDSEKKYEAEDWPGILVLPNLLVKDNFPYSIQYPLYGYTVYTPIFKHNHIPGESPKLSQAALCCLISVCHAEDVTQPLEWSCHLV